MKQNKDIKYVTYVIYKYSLTFLTLWNIECYYIARVCAQITSNLFEYSPSISWTMGCYCLLLPICYVLFTLSCWIQFWVKQFLKLMQKKSLQCFANF